MQYALDHVVKIMHFDICVYRPQLTAEDMPCYALYCSVTTAQGAYRQLDQQLIICIITTNGTALMAVCGQELNDALVRARSVRPSHSHSITPTVTAAAAACRELMVPATATVVARGFGGTRPPW